MCLHGHFTLLQPQVTAYIQLKTEQLICFLQGTFFSDIVLSFFCGQCALVQEAQVSR